MSKITVDDSFNKYFKYSFIEDVICDSFPYDRYKTRNMAFTRCRTLK